MPEDPAVFPFRAGSWAVTVSWFISAFTVLFAPKSGAIWYTRRMTKMVAQAETWELAGSRFSLFSVCDGQIDGRLMWIHSLVVRVHVCHPQVLG